MASISLSNVAANRRTIEVDLGLPPKDDGTAQTLTVTYRVNTLTLNDQSRFNAFGDELTPDDVNWFASLFERLLVSWGILGPMAGPDGVELFADGAPVPITNETVRLVDAVTMMTIFTACMKDTNDPKASAPTGASTTTPSS